MANADIRLQPGISGSWIVGGDGQGAFINIADVNGDSVFVVSWYTYLHGDQVWLLGSKSMTENSAQVTIPVQRTSGADFGRFFDSDDVNKTDWGTLTFRFSSCDSGTVQYQTDSPNFGSSSTLSLTRLTNTKGLSCDNTATNPTPPAVSVPQRSTTIVCVDNIPKEVCDIVGQEKDINVDYIPDGVCSVLFPQDVYAPDLDPALKDTCGTGGLFNCGLCRVIQTNTTFSSKKSSAFIKQADFNSNVDLIGNILHKSLLKFDNGLATHYQ
jgi:hypothetical protein